MLKSLLLSLLSALLISQRAVSQDSSNAFVPRDVVILQSTRSYPAALQTARQAASRLQVPLDLEGYRPNPTSGLTMSKAECLDNGFTYPAYVARGRAPEAAAFVSVEYSDGYNGFAPGYYIVVAAVGEPGSSVVRRTSTAARRWYADAYAKRTKVYMGCMH